MFGMTDDADVEDHLKCQEILKHHSDVLIPELALALNSAIDKLEIPIMEDYLEQIMGAI